MSYRTDRFSADSTVQTVAGTVRVGITNKFSTALGAIVQPLPAGSTLRAGDFLWIKKTAGTNLLTVTPAGGDTINGSASAVTVADSLLFLRDSTNTNWISLATGGAPFLTPDSTTLVASTTLTSNKIFKYNTTAGAIAQTLPSAASFSPGDAVVLKKLDGINNLTVTPAGGDTLDGGAVSSVVITAPQGSATFVKDASGLNNWLVL